MHEYALDLNLFKSIQYIKKPNKHPKHKQNKTNKLHKPNQTHKKNPHHI